MEHRVVVVGGGFAGLRAVQGLKWAKVQVTLLDRRNFHLFQPLLYQVATGGLSPANIAAPLRGILRNQSNTQVLLCQVHDVDVKKRVVISDLGEHPYDTLVIATGARHTYFGNHQWEEHAPGLKTLEDAIEMRRRILSAFEEAESHAHDAERVRKCLTFVVVGGGPTGVELAGAIADLALHTLRKNFRGISPESTKIYLIEFSPHILQMYPERLRNKAVQALEKLGVTVLLNHRVTNIDSEQVTLSHQEEIKTLPARVVLWGAGVQASSLGKIIATQCGLETDKQGRVPVQLDCTLEGHPEILVLGDLARFQGPDGNPLPGVAPTAMQMGLYAARFISNRLVSKKTQAFRYRDKGSMATIGRG